MDFASLMGFGRNVFVCPRLSMTQKYTQKFSLIARNAAEIQKCSRNAEMQQKFRNQAQDIEIQPDTQKYVQIFTNKQKYNPVLQL